MIEEENKSARIDARLPESVLILLRRAADLQGRTLSDFVICSAREAAERRSLGTRYLNYRVRISNVLRKLFWHRRLLLKR